MGVADPETGHEYRGLVGLAVPILVREQQQAVEIADDQGNEPILLDQGLDALDHGQALGEAHGLIGLSIAVGVLEPQDVITRLHAGDGLRIGR